MRILVTSLPDLLRIPVQRPHHLIHHLSETHYVTVWCVQATHESLRHEPYTQDLLSKIEFGYLTARKMHPALQELSVWAGHSIKSKHHKSEYDLHLNFNSLIAGYYHAHFMNKAGIPTIFDVCDDIPEYISRSPRIPPGLGTVSGFAGKILMGMNVDISAQITYTTPGLQSCYHLPPERSRLMPNGVDTTFFYPQSGAGIRNIWGFAPGDFVCGFIGNLHGWVNLEPVFLALHDLHPTFPALKLLVVGGGEKFSYFVDMAARYGISNQVVFTGPVPYSQGPAYIAAMDAGLLCRLPTQDSQNSLPVKLFEYAACGKPVIATPLNGVRQCFGNRLIYAENGLEFANAIKDLASHREKGNAIGEEGRKYVMEHFSWDAIFRQFDGLIKEVKG